VSDCIIEKFLVNMGRRYFSRVMHVGQSCCNAWVSKFLQQRSTPLIVGWFVGRTWENNSQWYNRRPKLFCIFI